MPLEALRARSTSSRDSVWTRWGRTGLLPLGVFAYLVIVRTHDISRSFWLLGDQIRDWTIALRPWHDLPLTGPPSSVGGASIGPVFYWVLWGIRQLVGPWTDNLPHAGGIGLSVIQSLADAVLLVALWHRTSVWLALAVTLLVATAPQDLALTATIWNPPLAVAFTKIAIAATLLTAEAPSIAWTALTAACAWLAVQAHSSALFAAVSVLAVHPLRALLEQGWPSALKRAGVVTAVIALLQVPMLVHMIANPGERPLPGLVTSGVIYTFTHPTSLRPGASLIALSSATGFILFSRPESVAFAVILVLAIAVVVWRRRDLTLVMVSVVPLVLATLGFATWQYGFDHYWYLTLMPSTALALLVAVTEWRPLPTSVGLLVVVLALQPARVAEGRTIARLPEYRLLVDGSRAIRRHTAAVAAIRTGFPVPPATDREFLFRILGGQIREDAPLVATIGIDGRVTYTTVSH